MKGGTKTLLFGVHNFVMHPIFVLVAWYILNRRLPNFKQLCAIITHDWGLWGMPNVDGPEAEQHPRIMYEWWLRRGEFWRETAEEVLGHSRFFAAQHGLSLSKLFYADKLCIILYPKLLYLLLGTLSGEIHEYMNRTKGGKYDGVNSCSKISWLLETTAHMTLHGFGKKNSLNTQEKH